MKIHEDGILELTDLPQKPPHDTATVIRLEFPDGPRINQNVVSDDIGNFRIPATLGTVHGGEIGITEGGVTRWFDTNAYLSFKFLCDEPGSYNVQLNLKPRHFADFGHEVSISYNNMELSAVLDKVIDGQSYDNPNERCIYDIGTIDVSSPGEHEIFIRAKHIVRKSGCGLMLGEVNLIRNHTGVAQP